MEARKSAERNRFECRAVDFDYTGTHMRMNKNVYNVYAITKHPIPPARFRR